MWATRQHTLYLNAKSKPKPVLCLIFDSPKPSSPKCKTDASLQKTGKSLTRKSTPLMSSPNGHTSSSSSPDAARDRLRFVKKDVFFFGAWNQNENPAILLQSFLTNQSFNSPKIEIIQSWYQSYSYKDNGSTNESSKLTIKFTFNFPNLRISMFFTLYEQYQCWEDMRDVIP